MLRQVCQVVTFVCLAPLVASAGAISAQVGPPIDELRAMEVVCELELISCSKLPLSSPRELGMSARLIDTELAIYSRRELEASAVKQSDLGLFPFSDIPDARELIPDSPDLEGPIKPPQKSSI